MDGLVFLCRHHSPLQFAHGTPLPLAPPHAPPHAHTQTNYKLLQATSTSTSTPRTSGNAAQRRQAPLGRRDPGTAGTYIRDKVVARVWCVIPPPRQPKFPAAPPAGPAPLFFHPLPFSFKSNQPTHSTPPSSFPLKHNSAASTPLPPVSPPSRASPPRARSPPPLMPSTPSSTMNMTLSSSVPVVRACVPPWVLRRQGLKLRV